MQYESRITAGGIHNLAVRVQFGELDLLSPDQSFELDIQPPNPMLLSPPDQIVRQAPEDYPYNAGNLLPTEETIEFLVEFPDGHIRPIKRASLFVDDEMVTEITLPPFDKFIWDISKYTASGEHSLKVEVEDSLGLTKMSVGIPLTLTLVQPPIGILAFFGRNSAVLTIGVVALTGLLLVVILLVGGSRRMKSFSTRRKNKAASHDPVSQPIPTKKAGQLKTLRFPFRGLPQLQRAAKASAYLIPLNGKGESATGTVIQLTGEKMSFGTDPVKVKFVLDAPSISPLHAELSQNEQGAFLLSDKKSVAGTWVNFKELESDGKILEHDDIISFGLLRYKFSVAKPPKEDKVEVRIEELA